MRRYGRLLPIVAIALAVAGCGSSGGQAGDDQGGATSQTAAEKDPLAELIAAAQKEGELTHYASSADAYSKAQAEGFEKEYGIKVNVIKLSASKLIERFSAEEKSGVHTADMLTHTDMSIYEGEPDWFLKLSDDNVPYMANYPDWTKENDRCVVLNENVQGITYNTDLVPEDKIPVTWKDMLDPFWKGKILVTDPRSTPAYMSWAAVVEQAYGIGYLEDLAKQDFDLVDSATPGAQQVAAGAYLANFPAHLSNSGALREQGAPLKMVIVKDAPGGGVACIGIPKDAPHPNAARLFLNWRMSPDGQAAGCAATEIIPPIPDVKGCIEPPEGWKLPTADFSDPAYQAKLVKALGITN